MMLLRMSPLRLTHEQCFKVQHGKKHKRLSRSNDQHSKAHAVSKESYRRTAAERAVDAFIEDDTVVGLGHGTMVVYAIEVIGQRLKQGLLSGVTCLALSDIAVAEAAVQGVPLNDFEEDELQAARVRNQISKQIKHSIGTLEFASFVVGLLYTERSDLRGRAPLEVSAQQPQLPLLRALMSRSKECIGLVADPEAVVSRLGGSLPIVVESEGWEATAEEVDDIFIGDAEVWRRSQTEGAGPRGDPDPCISPAGHNILDVKFLSTLKLYGDNTSYQQIINEILRVKGVITHGLFLNAIKAAVVATGPEAKIIEKGLMLGFRDEREDRGV